MNMVSFMYFEAITLIPMDLDAINPDIMTQEDKKLLNDYHAKVYEVIAPYLNEEEQEWLKKYTRAILTCEDGFFQRFASK